MFPSQIIIARFHLRSLSHVSISDHYCMFPSQIIIAYLHLRLLSHVSISDHYHVSISDHCDTISPQITTISDHHQMFPSQIPTTFNHPTLSLSLSCGSTDDMSPEVISQASYSTILTIAFDLRHRLEYLTFGDKERQLFNFRFLHRLYGERCTCKSCGASGAAHIPNESEHLNLSGYLMEWGVVGHIKGKCICCGAPFSHFSCESSDISKLDPKFRIYGIELKYYSMKATHHSLLHNMMELVLLESIDDDKQRQEAFAAISSFMHLGVKRVSDLWCRPDYYQIRKDKFERWKRDTLLVPGSHPLIPPQSYRSYFEMYEMLSRSFVENSVAVASALDLIQYALVDNPSVRNFKMILGAAMMYLNRFQEFIRLHDPKEFMIPSDPLYQQVKHRFIASDLSIVKRMLVIIMIYEMPQFYHYGDFVRVANGEKDMFTHGGVDLCRYG